MLSTTHNAPTLSTWPGGTTLFTGKSNHPACTSSSRLRHARRPAWHRKRSRTVKRLCRGPGGTPDSSGGGRRARRRRPGSGSARPWRSPARRTGIHRRCGMALTGKPDVTCRSTTASRTVRAGRVGECGRHWALRVGSTLPDPLCGVSEATSPVEWIGGALRRQGDPAAPARRGWACAATRCRVVTVRLCPRSGAGRCPPSPASSSR